VADYSTRLKAAGAIEVAAIVPRLSGDEASRYHGAGEIKLTGEGGGFVIQHERKCACRDFLLIEVGHK